MTFEMRVPPAGDRVGLADHNRPDRARRRTTTAQPVVHFEITAPDGTGIRGGVGGGPTHTPQTLFYVQVDDVAAALERAVALGATRVMGPETAPNGLVVAQFADPEGNLIGIAGG